MENIKNKLGEYKYNFFHNMQNYLNTELIFFGSIKRSDYFDNASDIDIAIITDNVNSLITKIQNYLNINNKNIKKIYQQYTVNDKLVINGHKIKYEDNDNQLVFDILIYDEKYKPYVIQNINEINNLPLYIVYILYILKYLYYTLGLISKNYYVNIKCYIFHCYFNKKIKMYDKQHTTTIIL